VSELYLVIVNYLSDALQSEVFKMTLAFMLAARLHRGWVKKDMAEQFGRITESIDNVAEKMRLGFENHEARISALEKGKKK